MSNRRTGKFDRIERRMRRGPAAGIRWLAAFVLLLFGALPARARVNGQAEAVADPRWAILVAGSSGEPDLQKQYLQELTDLRGVLEGPLAFPRSHVFTLFDNPTLDPARIQYQSTRENLARVCQDIASRAGKDDLVFIFLEGHGSSDGKVYKLNLVGPDPTAEELAGMFYAIPAQRFIVVNVTSCSGESLAALAGKGRVVVTATRSGNEKIVTRLGRFFVEAFTGNNADVDKNGRVSVLEAFNYAARRMEEYYAKEGSLQTEHPVVSDNGETPALTSEETGSRAALLSRSSYLDRGSPLLAGGSSPESQVLAREAQALEKQIELLKSVKDEMSEAEYERRLEELLLKLAGIQAQLRKK